MEASAPATRCRHSHQKLNRSHGLVASTQLLTSPPSALLGSWVCALPLCQPCRAASSACCWQAEALRFFRAALVGACCWRARRTHRPFGSLCPAVATAARWRAGLTTRRRCAATPWPLWLRRCCSWCRLRGLACCRWWWPTSLTSFGTATRRWVPEGQACAGSAGSSRSGRGGRVACRRCRRCGAQLASLPMLCSTPGTDCLPPAVPVPARRVCAGRGAGGRRDPRGAAVGGGGAPDSHRRRDSVRGWERQPGPCGAQAYPCSACALCRASAGHPNRSPPTHPPTTCLPGYPACLQVGGHCRGAGGGGAAGGGGRAAARGRARHF